MLKLQVTGGWLAGLGGAAETGGAPPARASDGGGTALRLGPFGPPVRRL